MGEYFVYTRYSETPQGELLRSELLFPVPSEQFARSLANLAELGYRTIDIVKLENGKFYRDSGGKWLEIQLSSIKIDKNSLDARTRSADNAAAVPAGKT